MSTVASGDTYNVSGPTEYGDVVNSGGTLNVL
jgi:autotransporter passenger strand-loop-strand repeat protein